MLAPAASAAIRNAAASLRLSTWWSSGLSTAPASLPARCGSRRRVSAADIHCSGKPELLLEHELMVQPGLIVRGQGDDQGSFLSQLHVDSRGLQELRGEGGPARLALAPERDQRFLAGLGLRAGRQHAGSGMARAGAGGALVEHRDRRAARRQPPGDAEPDDAGADDGDV